MRSEKVLLVGNPSARSGKARTSMERARLHLEARGERALTLHTQPGGVTPELVQRAILSESPTLVLAMGGDGTFNEVARGVLAASESDPSKTLPLGLLPMGTANDQARSFGLNDGERALEENVNIALRGKTLKIDVGVITKHLGEEYGSEGTHFFDSASFGMAPEVLWARNRDRNEVSNVPLLGRVYKHEAVYVGATFDRVLASFAEPAMFSAKISGADKSGEVWTRNYEEVTDLLFKGTAVFGGGWVFERENSPDDGLFEMVVVPSRRAWFTHVVRDHMVVPNFLHRLGRKNQEPLRGSWFEVELKPRTGETPARQAIRTMGERLSVLPGASLIPEHGIASQVDGEEWKRGFRFRIEVLHQRLPLRVPVEYKNPWVRSKS